MSLIEGTGATNGNANNATNTGTNNAGNDGHANNAGNNNGENNNQNSNDWYYAENIKGEGSQPDWFKVDKYKTVTDQAKAYSEVEKKLGAFKGAPEKYDLTIKDHDIKFSEDDPLLKDFLEGARKNGVSQEYVSEILGVYAQALTYNVPNADEEKKKIGVNADQDLKILAQWAGNLLSADEFNIFKGMITTADSFKVFDKLRNSGVTAEVTDSSNKHAGETQDQVLALISDPRYDSDPAFRAEVREKLSRAMARQGGKK